MDYLWLQCSSGALDQLSALPSERWLSFFDFHPNRGNCPGVSPCSKNRSWWLCRDLFVASPELSEFCRRLFDFLLEHFIVLWGGLLIPRKFIWSCRSWRIFNQVVETNRSYSGSCCRPWSSAESVWKNRRTLWISSGTFLHSRCVYNSGFCWWISGPLHFHTQQWV